MSQWAVSSFAASATDHSQTDSKRLRASLGDPQQHLPHSSAVRGSRTISPWTKRRQDAKSTQSRGKYNSRLYLLGFELSLLTRILYEETAQNRRARTVVRPKEDQMPTLLNLTAGLMELGAGRGGKPISWVTARSNYVCHSARQSFAFADCWQGIWVKLKFVPRAAGPHAIGSTFRSRDYGLGGAVGARTYRPFSKRSTASKPEQYG